MADNLGAARTATAGETRDRFGNGDAGGLYLARHYDRDAGTAGEPIVYGGERHFLMFGPNGSGKGTRFLLPNLLGLGLKGRSIIAVDPKGELAAISAMHQHQIGQCVKILDPFGVLAGIVAARPDAYRYLVEHGLVESVGFNPLDGLDPEASTFFDDATAIGEALIKIQGSDPHWSESAQGLVVGLVMWEKLRRGADASLENVRLMLTEAEKLQTMTDASGREVAIPVQGLRATAADMAAEGGYEIASLGARFIHASDEINSIRSTADTQTRWLLSEPVRKDLAKRGLDFSRLKDEPTTVYVILPAERLRTHSVWLRLVIVSALRALYRPGGLRTWLLIDELAALGHLGPLEDAFGLVRGYGVQIAAILQDLNQLQALYDKRWETFIANAGVVMGFAPNDLTTAEWMSKRAGQTTIAVTSRSENIGQGASGQSLGSGTSTQAAARPLFLPQELISLEEGTGLLWLAGMANPVTFFGPPYFKIRDCRERALPNPYYRSSG